MVSLKDRMGYLSSIKDDNILSLFYTFIQNKKNPIDLNQYQNQMDKDFALFVQTLILDKKDDFINLYNQFSAKKPSLTSPWVNNDYLIFSIIVGICRFKVDRKWIIKVLNTRKTQDIIQEQINRTLINIVTNNLNSNDNLFEIIIVFQNLQNQSPFKDKFNELYCHVMENHNLFSRKYDFLTCLSIRALDIIICSKGFINIEENEFLHKFSTKFLKRTQIISSVFYAIIICCLVCLSIYLYLKNEKTFNAITTILGFLGVGLSGLFKYIHPTLVKTIRKLLGYNTSIHQ